MRLLVTQSCMRALLNWQGFPSQLNPTEQSSSQKIIDDNRHIADRLGSGLGRQVSKWHMEPPLVIRTHKCTGTEDCSSHSQGSVIIFMPQACASENGQYLGSLHVNHQSGMKSGGNASADIGMATAVITENNPHPGYGKQSSWHFVQNRASPRRVVFTHRSNSPNFSPIRDSSGRNFCLQGNNLLPGMVLHHGTRREIGPGCSVTRMAAYYTNIIPPFLWFPTRVREGHCTVLLVAPCWLGRP